MPAPCLYNIYVNENIGTLHSYTYNNANRLKAVTIGGMLKGTFTYNGLEQPAVRDLPASTPARVVGSIYDRKGNLIAEADGATLGEYLRLEDKRRHKVAAPNFCLRQGWIANLVMSSLCEIRGGLNRALRDDFQIVLDFLLWMLRLWLKIKTDSRIFPSDGLVSKATYL